MIYQEMAHHLRGYREEVSAVLPVNAIVANHSQVSFVD
jgi:hypothetical protein